MGCLKAPKKMTHARTYKISWIMLGHLDKLGTGGYSKQQPKKWAGVGILQPKVAVFTHPSGCFLHSLEDFMKV